MPINYNLRDLSPEEKRRLTEFDRKQAARAAVTTQDVIRKAKERRERRAKRRAADRARTLTTQQKEAA